MSLTVTRGYRNLAIIAAISIYLLIIAGGAVRVSGAGLGCPDWPTCYGSLLPPNGSDIETHPDGEVLIIEMGSLPKATTAARVEYTHRIIATLGGIVILLTIGGAWQYYRQIKWIFIPANLIIGLLVVQIPLGGIVVLSELEPLLVGIHLGIALAIFASALAIVLRAFYPEISAQTVTETIRKQRKRLMVTSSALFIAFMFGAGVVGSNTGLSCPDYPFCNTTLDVYLVPPAGVSSRVWYHLLHRYTIVIFSIILIWALLKTLRDQGNIPVIKRWGVILAGLFVTQVTIGAIQVWMEKPAFLRGLHLAVASAVWMSVVVLTLLQYLGVPSQQAITTKPESAPDESIA